MRERRAFIKALNRAVAMSEATASQAREISATHLRLSDESSVVHASMPAREEKDARSAAHRKAGETKGAAGTIRAASLSFEQRIGPTDNLRARGMGVLLD